MNYGQFTPALAFMTLGFVTAYAVMSYVNVSRKRQERRDTPLTRSSEAKRTNQGSIINK